MFPKRDVTVVGERTENSTDLILECIEHELCIELFVLSVTHPPTCVWD